MYFSTSIASSFRIFAVETSKTVEQMKRFLTLGLLLLTLLPWQATARETRSAVSLTEPVTIGSGEDFHLTGTSEVLPQGVTVTLTAPDGWLFFDNVRPNDVVSLYASQIIIGGHPFDPETNGRIAVYRQGTVVMAQNRDYEALTATGKGCTETFLCNYYYSNQPPVNAPERLLKPLDIDNGITHIHLSRGYMATLACEPDGMGYSRVFIADEDDIDADLPRELAGKVSYVRVLRWQYPSKKGWVGSTWTAMPEGLKYAFQQADKTHSTWYYNWGSSATVDPNHPDAKTYNQEFVPEKWGAGGLWDGVYSIEDATHLLGYNEPDHSEQSNVTVDKAIEEWPLMVQTGLRLGSPATTSFTWLYNFMEQCKKRNYRVDYVVVHAYWGGMSASEWYRDLKAVHDRTGRPIWIKEWNNGANWTKESWPSDKQEQYAKQLRDLTAIVGMLDTCSFIERYSLYNWVEDKRMVIDKSGNLTPAGEMYAADEPAYFFNREGEVIPQWTVRDAPVLAYDSIDNERKMHISWTDANGEQIDHYTLAVDGQTASDGLTSHTAEVALTEDSDGKDQVSLTVTSVPADSSQEGKTSNAVTCHVADNTSDAVFLGETLVQQSWQPMLMRQTCAETPVLLLGTPTYRNKMPLSPLTRNVDGGHFDFALRAWMYQENPSFYAPDTLSYMFLPQGRYHWNGVEAEAGHIGNVRDEWQHVSFSTPFAVMPVVIASLSVGSDTTATAVVRNVTATGFDVRLRLEGKEAAQHTAGRVDYLAATPGKGNLDGKTIVVGRTDDHAVGSNLTSVFELPYGEAFAAIPFFFAQTQTENDTVAATLRQQGRNRLSTGIFKDREKSDSHALVAAEQVGFIAIGTAAATSVRPVVPSTEDDREWWYTTSGMLLHQHPTSQGVYIHKEKDGTRLVLVK